ncbi:hypothetical protein Tco_0934636 [Tanacetum coccineum]
MDTEEDSDRYIAQCFVNGLYASDGEINLEKNDNLISNDYAVKLCLEYEVRKGNKLVKKELMVLLHGEIYFVQFILNSKKDEFEPGLIFRISFSRSANAIVNFGEGTITIKPDFDPFLLSSDEEGNPNLDNIEMLLDFDFDEENIMYFNNGVGPSSSVGTPLTQEEAEKRALAYNISMRYEMLEEVRPVIETLAYNDKYKKLLDKIQAGKVRLDGKIKPEEERAMVKVKGHMLKEKKDPWAFIFPIRLEGLINENALTDTRSNTNTMSYRTYEQLNRDDIMQEERNITMINYTEAEVTGRLVNVLFQVGFTTLSAQFLILEIPIDQDAPIVIKKIRIAESDSDDEEDYVIKRNDMGTPIHNSRPIGYQNNTNPAENITLSTLESVINPFRKISMWKKATSGACGHEAGSSRAKRSRNIETVEEVLILDVHHKFLEWSCCSREAKSRYNTKLAILLPKLIYSPQIVDWQLLHKIGCGEEIDNMLKISLKEAEFSEEIFFFMAWVRAFNIREPIYPELCHEFYATYEFDKVCADDELQSKNIISFRLGGHDHSLTLLEFARRLGLYHVDELEEEGFDTYFQGGLRSDENFNAREYWERISTDRDLHLSRSSITSVRFPILRVLHKMITYGLCQRTTRYEKIQRNDLDLDKTTLRELIDSEGRLILDILVDNVPRVAA